ncbi:MAG TPA: hypothetical protein DDW23_00600 [Planctomycetes bacterium]|nr:hypothetical protein [Planctomycetota bacterium]|tara:strand:- start:46 stop:951 length:906 start_codon:yes stop_codon:yes gene_type:complete
MKLVQFVGGADSSPQLGLLLPNGEEVVDVFAAASGLSAPACRHELFDLAGDLISEIRVFAASFEEENALEALRNSGCVLAKNSLNLLSPVPKPRKLIAIGRNYREHAEEQGADIPTEPLIFSKFSTSVVGPGAVVRIPQGCENLDYEAELGVVIGRKTKDVSPAEAGDSVFGYLNINDISARDFQFGDGQWQRGKSCDTFAPMGEYIATTDEIPDPQNLAIRFRLNGEVLQDSHTSMMIFPIPEIISYASRFFTLEPGDVIATGTPSGVGFARTPPIWLKEGDLMEVEIDGLGILANAVGC